jgi:PAS domain S-box-containing protein/diguanylate cyclase (GGDEF)-like protein
VEVGVDDDRGIGIDFGSAMSDASFGVLITAIGSGDNRIVFANSAFEVLTGYDAQDVIGLNCRFLQGQDTDGSVVAEIREAVGAGQPIRRELLNYRKDGRRFWNELSLSPRFDRRGGVIGYVGILNDVSARHRAEEAQRTAEEAQREAEMHLASIIENVPGYVYRRVLKPDGTIKFHYLSSPFTRMLRLPEGEEATLIEVRRHMHPSDIISSDSAIRQSAASMSPFDIEFRVFTSNGETRWIRSYLNPRRSGEDVVWDAIGIDVTAEKTAEARLAYLAYNDPLTGLPNRSLFQLSLRNAIAETAGSGPLELVHVDVSGLQEVNESLGRAAGDAVVRGMAARLTTLASEHSGMIVARTGEDEFAVMQRGIAQEAEATAFAELVGRSLAQPITIDGKKLTIESRMGFTIYADGTVLSMPASDEVSIELMRQADVALSAAKSNGSDSLRCYESGLDDQVRNRMRLKQSLQLAVTEEQFELHYHPLVDLASGKIVGAEALIRWRHPELGMQRPDLFIPLAEESGLIVPLGEWTVREAMRQVHVWRQAGLRTPRIAINVSTKQIQQSDFTTMLERALVDFGGDATDFELELTEGVMIERSPAILAVLNRIKACGFTLAVDDFGTGYSSLQYLRDLPVDTIKIDQTFIRRMVLGSSDASIIRAIIAVARSLDLDVVAEGIETTMQRDFLRDEGCLTGQGYLFSLPLVPEDFAWLLEHDTLLPRGAPGRETPEEQGS